MTLQVVRHKHKNREKLGVMRLLLRQAANTDIRMRTKTRMMYHCLMSSTQTSVYIQFLIENKFLVSSVEIVHHAGPVLVYSLTENGKHLLELLDKFFEVFPFLSKFGTT